MYRLHIDIPLAISQEVAIDRAQHAVAIVIDALRREDWGEGLELNYRLGNDDDRGAKNYLDINGNGHCSNKKTRVTI